MARPRDVMEGIGRALTQSDKLAEIEDYTLVAPDGQRRQADLKIPFAELRSIGGKVRQQNASTAFVRWVRGEEYPDYLKSEYGTEDYGEGSYSGIFDPNDKIGRIFEATYQMDVDLTVWDFETDAHTAQDIAALGERVETVLWQYDSQMRGGLLPSGDGTGIGAVTDLFVGDRELTEDLAQNPALRGSRQELSVRFGHRLDTVAEYGPGAVVKHVDTPKPGEMTAALPDEKWSIEYNPPIDIEAEIGSDFDVGIEGSDSNETRNQWTLRNG